ncbi:CAP domain-containing protein [Streptomyces sudanensis]|uniref:CAP domain-containing protein n=1 Tax=Streptomyces sudanensis TaxID=436397 RepID=UPI0020CD80D9|nr:CAP domain-containing protein [Streptomyces sudanensis]
MGRHRRSGAAPAEDEYAVGGPRGHRGARRRKRALPLRGGLLGASAAMAVGVAAVASGVLPGGGTFVVSGGVPQEQMRSSEVAGPDTQGGAGAVPRTGTPSAAAPGTSRSPAASPEARPKAPSRTPSGTPDGTPSAAPSKTRPKAPSPRASTPSSPPVRTRAASPAPTEAKPPVLPPRTEAPSPERTTAPPSPRTVTSQAVAMEAAVLDLVNRERAAVGCSPVRASAELGDLARAFSQDMAERGFFSHTDPDGDDPWARAAQAGVEGLGGENIAYGQTDANAVMEAWMNSDGHRANILNCDFKRLGVGVHIADGGPWWTQNFGF